MALPKLKSLRVLIVVCCLVVFGVTKVTFRAKSLDPEDAQKTYAKTMDSFVEQYPSSTEMRTHHISEGLESGKNKLNVLFMMTDDMRTQLECYEGPDYLFKQSEMKTPHLNRLAAKSLLLRNAFVQYSLCGPSRTSMLTGRRPDTTKIYGNHKFWRANTANFTTLPEHFKNHGYTSLGTGKIYHLGPASNFSDPMSWSEPFDHSSNSDNYYIKNSTNGRWFPVPDDKLGETPLIDMLSVRKGVEYLERFAESKHQPFFLALGFKKPHAAQVCPQSFYDLYSIDTENRYLTEKEETKAGVDELTLKQFRRAYYACISYVDSLVGEILDALERLGLQNSTIVSFVADHGYHYGEHGWMGKSKTFDMTTKVPLMIHIPGRTDKGIVSNSIVEAVDIFPTIVEAAGLDPVPTCKDSRTPVCTEGLSLLPLIERPETQIKQGAYTQMSGNKQETRMLYSVRTTKFRFSQWATQTATGSGYNLQEDSDMELYDHSVDFKEYNNVAYQPLYKDVVRKLRRKLNNYADRRYLTDFSE